MSCLNAPDGGSTFTLIVRDISERMEFEEARQRQAQSLADSAKELKQLNEELHRRQFELERAMTARSRFYASMSHELRTPINAVLGYSTLLLERIYGPLNDKQVEGIERTQKAARHLLELVNDVLDLSKIEAGKIDLRLQPVEVPALVEDLFVTVRPLADEHGSALTLDQTVDAADQDHLGSATAAPDPAQSCCRTRSSLGAASRSSVTCTPTEPDAGVDIAVTDQGEGISKEDQERIFHEFVQLGKTQLQDGTGLGLPISRRLAELLRGSLTVKSTMGEGSTFCLHLPATAEARSGYRPSDQELPREATPERSRGAASRSAKRLFRHERLPRPRDARGR